ncbi:serine hydrolase [Paenirhodobacter sp.]|uniref:serine hydrolase n=1 Tax=Paenirhodobacter sp. TaxID=1965326 RepID=UPI003B3E7D1F
MPVTAETLVELGSIRKTFNVVLAALAAKQGHLSLADPVAVHLPELKGSAIGLVSLMDLATHQTGGLPLRGPNAAGDEGKLMRWLGEWQPVPGQGERSYSDVSIGFLGRITARAFGETYPRRCKPMSCNRWGWKAPMSMCRRQKCRAMPRAIRAGTTAPSG